MGGRAVALWRNNRIDAEWHIDLEELARRFAASGWAGQPWPLRRRILLFVTSPDGLCSTFLDEDYDALEAACRNAAVAAEPA